MVVDAVSTLVPASDSDEDEFNIKAAATTIIKTLIPEMRAFFTGLHG